MREALEFKCKWERCNEVSAYADLTKHLQTCANRPLDCPMEGAACWRGMISKGLLVSLQCAGQTTPVGSGKRFTSPYLEIVAGQPLVLNWTRQAANAWLRQLCLKSICIGTCKASLRRSRAGRTRAWSSATSAWSRPCRHQHRSRSRERSITGTKYVLWPQTIANIETPHSAQVGPYNVGHATVRMNRRGLPRPPAPQLRLHHARPPYRRPGMIQTPLGSRRPRKTPTSSSAPWHGRHCVVQLVHCVVSMFAMI
jgi:hypothetical protein